MRDWHYKRATRTASIIYAEDRIRGSRFGADRDVDGNTRAQVAAAFGYGRFNGGGAARRPSPVADPAIKARVAREMAHKTSEAKAMDHAREVVGAVIASGAQIITRHDVGIALLRATPDTRADLLGYPSAIPRALDEAVERGDLVKGCGQAYHVPQVPADRILNITGPRVFQGAMR